MHQTANSQNTQFDTKYKHNIQRVLAFLLIFPTHDPTRPNPWVDQTYGGQLWCNLIQIRFIKLRCRNKTNEKRRESAHSPSYCHPPRRYGPIAPRGFVTIYHAFICLMQLGVMRFVVSRTSRPKHVFRCVNFPKQINVFLRYGIVWLMSI